MAKSHHQRKYLRKKLWDIGLIFRILPLALLCITVGAFTCHPKCNCLWRNGKQTAICREIAITKIPHDLDSGVQVLDLRGNAITYLPRHTFMDAGLTNLQRLHIPECRVEQIDELAFFRLSNLIDLDMSENRLSIVPSISFRQLPSLRQLNLKSNRLTFLGHQAFSDLKSLIQLDVSQNRIDSVAVGAFEGLDKLEMLNIESNLLETLSGKAMLPVKSLNAMYLDGNLWRCDCELRALRLWLEARNIPYVPPMCEKPPRVKGRTWKSLNKDEFACAPSFLNSTSAFHVFDGANITLECRSMGDPLPNIQWYWRDRVLGNMSEGISPRQIFTVTERGERQKLSALTVTSIQEPNAGTYSCKAENVAASLLKNFTVHVSRRPVTEVKPIGGTSGGPVHGNHHEEEKTQEVREQEAGEVTGAEEGEDKGDPLIGLIVGVVVGALLVLVIFTIVLLVCRRKRRERRKRNENSTAGGSLNKLAPTEKSPDGPETKLLSPRPTSVSILPPSYLHRHELDPMEPLMDQHLSPHVWVVKDHMPSEWQPRRSPIPVPMPVAPNSTEAHVRLHSELTDTLRRKSGDRKIERERGDGSSEMEAQDVEDQAAGFETLRIRDLQDRSSGDEPDLLMLDRSKRVQPLPSIIDHHHPHHTGTLGRSGSPASYGVISAPQPRLEWGDSYEHPSAYFRPVQTSGHVMATPLPVLQTIKDNDDGGGSDGTEV